MVLAHLIIIIPYITGSNHLEHIDEDMYIYIYMDDCKPNRQVRCLDSR